MRGTFVDQGWLFVHLAETLVPPIHTLRKTGALGYDVLGGRRSKAFGRNDS
jgi:hypothetical protein